MNEKLLFNKLDCILNNLGMASSEIEVVQNGGPLTGAAPADAKLGIDTANGVMYYVVGGVWEPVPLTKTTISDETGADGTGLLVPTSPPSATPGAGDMHIEVYDDVMLYFTAVTDNWLAPSVIEVSKGSSASFSFVVGDWVVGTPSTLAILETDHGLGIGYRHVTVLDDTDTIVGIETQIDPLTGDIELKTAGAPFDGVAYIS